MLQPTMVEDAASEIAELTNAVAPGRLTFASEKPEDTFSSVTFDLGVSHLRLYQGRDIGQ